MSTGVRPDIYFIRHGQTNWNAEYRYQGRRDIPLNDVGRAQARANGLLLVELLERDGLDPRDLKWIASPMARARETMQLVRAPFQGGLPDVVYDERLMEISFGVYEGKLQSEVAGSGMRDAGDRDESHWHYRPDEGESYADLAGRALPVIESLTVPSVVVSHGGVARTFRQLVEGAPLLELVNWPPPQDAILHFKGADLNIIPSGYANFD